MVFLNTGIDYSALDLNKKQNLIFLLPCHWNM